MKRAKMKHKSGAYHGSSLDGERRQRAEEVQRGRGTVEAACEVAAEAARAHAAPAVAAAATGPGRPYAIHNTTVLISTHLENKAAMCKRLTYRVYTVCGALGTGSDDDGANPVFPSCLFFLFFLVCQYVTFC